MTISNGVVQATQELKFPTMEEVIAITNAYNTEQTGLLGESAGLVLMVLPQLPVELGPLVVEVELMLSFPSHPPAPHHLYYVISAL